MAKEKIPQVDASKIEVKVIHNPTAKVVPKVVPTGSEMPSFNVPNGWYHLIKVTPGGQEIAGTDVAVSPRDFKRTFEKLTPAQYKVKKNPN